MFALMAAAGAPWSNAWPPAMSLQRPTPRGAGLTRQQDMLEIHRSRQALRRQHARTLLLLLAAAAVVQLAGACSGHTPHPLERVIEVKGRRRSLLSFQARRCVKGTAAA